MTQVFMSYSSLLVAFVTHGIGLVLRQIHAVGVKCSFCVFVFCVALDYK